MAFPTKDYRQVRDSILRDIVNQQPDEYVGVDSDPYIRANASGVAVEGLYEHQKWIARQLFADTADSDYLELKHANPRGIYRKAATFATGKIRFLGTVGNAVPVGTESKTTNGIAFVTTASGVIGVSGQVYIDAKAVVAGVTGNQLASVALTLSAAPAGVQSQAVIFEMSGGTDTETDAELLARVLFYMRMPPMGGAIHDYYSWAMEVPGVTDAYVFTQRRVPNGVDVVIETAGGLASPELIAAVFAHIEAVRPPCVDLLVMVPTLVPVNITGDRVLDGITPAAADAANLAVLQAYFATLHVGDVVRKVKLESLITSTAGVLDVNLTSPAGNVMILADPTHSELAVLGAVALA